jgi:putative ABC transport system permease protein
MFKNYLKIALRNLLRHQGFSAINVVGLAVGMACCFIILLFVRHELRFDQFQARYDRLHRLNYTPKFAFDRPLGVAPPVSAAYLATEFPEVERVARVYGRSASLAVERPGQPDRQFEENKFFFVDSTLVDMFSFKFLAGDARTALLGKYQVVITDEMARKYFDQETALGKTILFAKTTPLVVAGVVEKYPSQSHLQFDFLASYETMFALESPVARANLDQNWVIGHSYIYVLLKPGQTAAAVNAKFPEFLNRHLPEQFRGQVDYALEPMAKLHLETAAANNPEPVGSLTTLYVLVGIAGLTLLIACINFINLSTARSLKRAKEVGMRKVLGAYKGQLVGQFMGESGLLGAAAFGLSLLLMLAALPAVNGLIDRQLSLLGVFTDPLLLGLFFGIFGLSVLLAGSYPAFFISRFQPTETLKANFAGAKAKGGWLRQALLVGQFAASILLIIGALGVYKQMQYLQNKPLGFDKEHLVVAGLASQNINNIFNKPSDSLYQRLRSFVGELKQSPGVQAAALSNNTLGQGSVRRGVVPEGKKPEDNLFLSWVAIDYDFLPTYGLNLAAGRNFSEAFPSDLKEGFIINETGAKAMGWPTAEAALGKGINLEGKKGRIVGVVRDFHSESLTQPLVGLLFDLTPSQMNLLTVKLKADNLPQALAQVEAKWNKFFPGKVFEATFLDQALAQQYQEQQRLGQIVGYFAGLAIFISCLGLFGLISLFTQQKIKEVGIRKVLGANLGQIVYLLSRNFAGLVLVAFAVAAPLAYYGMGQWLETFAYKTDLGAGMFLLAGAVVLLIALATMSFQTIKAALANPVKALRSE